MRWTIYALWISGMFLLGMGALCASPPKAHKAPVEPTSQTLLRMEAGALCLKAPECEKSTAQWLALGTHLNQPNGRLERLWGGLSIGNVPFGRLLVLIGVALLSLLACVLLRRILTWIAHLILRRWLKKLHPNPLNFSRTYPIVLWYFSWGITLWIVQFTIPYIQLPIPVAHYLSLALQVAAAFCITISAYRSVNMGYLYVKKWTDHTPSKWDDQVLILSRKLLKVLFLILGTWLILDILNVSILPLLTGLSIGGLALALAAQDMIKNFFGSVMIFLDKPFRIGDWIQYEGINGVVEEVGFRSTRLRTFADSVVAIPNAKLSDNLIDNFGLRVYRRYNTELHLLYENSSKQIESFVAALKGIVRQHAHTPTERAEIHLHKLTQTGPAILFYVFFKASNWSEELRARHEINTAILQAAEQLHIRFSSQTELSLHSSRSSAASSKKTVSLSTKHRGR